MSNKNYLDVEAVADFMGISIPTAYKIIRKLNKELKEKGYVTISGKVNRQYFETKVFGPVNQVALGGN